MAVQYSSTPVKGAGALAGRAPQSLLAGAYYSKLIPISCFRHRIIGVLCSSKTKFLSLSSPFPIPNRPPPVLIRCSPSTYEDMHTGGALVWNRREGRRAGGEDLYIPILLEYFL